VDPLDAFLAALRPLLRAHRARAAYLIGSRAPGRCGSRERSAGGPVAVDLFVYTPAEFERLRAEERPFLGHALDGAKVIHEG
jgi:hypothetical protein